MVPKNYQLTGSLPLDPLCCVPSSPLGWLCCKISELNYPFMVFNTNYIPGSWSRVCLPPPWHSRWGCQPEPPAPCPWTIRWSRESTFSIIAYQKLLPDLLADRNISDGLGEGLREVLAENCLISTFHIFWCIIHMQSWFNTSWWEERFKEVNLIPASLSCCCCWSCISASPSSSSWTSWRGASS